jgi:hypothetical protein
MQKYDSAASLSRELNDTQSAGIDRKSLPITTQARRYAVKELARRAGVSKAFFLTWHIAITHERTTISLGHETSRRIHFPHANSILEVAPRESIPVGRAAWFRTDKTGAPALVLPFCACDSDPRQPLYQVTRDGDVVCRMDLLSSFLFTLCRLEETLSRCRDEHGRFPASASLAVQRDFLERPILDEHGLAFEQIVSFFLPAWQPQPRALRFKLTHDIDDIGIPFELRTSIGHTLKRKNPAASVRDLLSSFTPAQPAELAAVLRLAAISEERNLPSAFYWKASPAGPRDSGYDPMHKKIRRVIDQLRFRGFEMGVHPGYETFGDVSKLAAEIARLRVAIAVDSPGGRQHYLRWSPQTWLDWEACGLSYDSSLGFADRFGFRAGTAFPYRPWCLSENRELNLIELPLLMMDCTPVKYMKIDPEEGLQRIKAMVERTKQTGGLFTLLWHNTPLLDPEYKGWYGSILDLFNNTQRFDLPPNVELLW